MPRQTLSGPVHHFEVAGNLVTHSGGQFAGDRHVVAALRRRLTDEPSVLEVDQAAREIAERRAEAFVPCDCDACTIVEEVL